MTTANYCVFRPRDGYVSKYDYRMSEARTVGESSARNLLPGATCDVVLLRVVARFRNGAWSDGWKKPQPKASRPQPKKAPERCNPLLKAIRAKIHDTKLPDAVRYEAWRLWMDVLAQEQAKNGKARK